MVICHPKVSCKNGSGFEVFNPSIQILIPRVFGEVMVQQAGMTFRNKDTRHAHDAILLVLAHLRLDLPSELVNRIQSKVESRELAATAAVISSAKTVPSGVVFQLDTWHRREGIETTTIFKQGRSGIRCDDAFNASLNRDGEE